MILQTPSDPEPVELPPPRDLRVELLVNLSSKFAAELETDATLPDEAKQALIGLLNEQAPTSADVIAALLESDAAKPDTSNE